MSLLPFNKLDINNVHLLTHSGHVYHSCINFPLQFALNQVDSTTVLLDSVVLTEVVLRPTEKPRSVGPHKSISKETRSKKKSLLKNKKLRSVSKPLCVGSVDPGSDDNAVPQQYTCRGSINSGNDSGEGIVPQRHIFCTNKDMKTYPLMDTETTIPIVTWKRTKNCSHIISDISIPGRIPHSNFDQRFKLNVKSPSISEKDIGLLYRLIERLLLTSKVTRPDVRACVLYIIARMKSSTKYHQDEQLNVDIIFVKKIWLFLLSSVENRCLHLESLFNKHTKYLLNIIQQIIQSQRMKAILTILGVTFENMKVWICKNLRNDQVNYATKSQVHTTTDTRIANNTSTNQGVETANDQYHKLHRELILSNTVTESNIQENYSYTSRIK